MKNLKRMVSWIFSLKHFVCSIYFGLGCGIIVLIIYCTNN